MIGKLQGKAFVFEMKDFDRLGLKQNEVEKWEDGMRTNGEKGNFEWRYFDVILEKSSTKRQLQSARMSLIHLKINVM